MGLLILLPLNGFSMWLSLGWLLGSKKECPKSKSSRHLSGSCKASYDLVSELTVMLPSHSIEEGNHWGHPRINGGDLDSTSQWEEMVQNLRIIPGYHKYPVSVQMDPFELLVFYIWFVQCKRESNEDQMSSTFYGLLCFF